MPMIYLLPTMTVTQLKNELLRFQGDEMVYLEDDKPIRCIELVNVRNFNSTYNYAETKESRDDKYIRIRSV